MKHAPVYYHNPDLKAEYYTIISQSQEPRVLLLETEKGMILPHFTPYEHASGAVNHINQATFERLGLKVTVLCHFDDDYNPANKHLVRTYVLENHTSDISQNDCWHWIDSHDLEQLELAIPRQRELIQKWFAGLNEDEISSYQLPWSETGWFSDTKEWISNQLKIIGYTHIGDIEQVMVWEQSCILRISTSSEDVYFKALPEMYAHEPQTIQILSKLYPNNTPSIVATDIERHWILMEEFSGKPLMDVSEDAHWLNALETYSTMQIDSVNRIDDFLEADFSDRRLHRFPSHIDALFADTDAMLPDHAGGLSGQEIEALHLLSPKLKTLCSKLTNSGIPQTLEHGDLHPHNIQVAEQGYLYFDWTLCAITHPFFSLAYFLQFLHERCQDKAKKIDSFRDAYLAPWRAFAPQKHLTKTLEYAQLLLPLYWAITYHQALLPKMDSKDRWLREKGIPTHLKQLLSKNI